MINLNLIIIIKIVFNRLLKVKLDKINLNMKKNGDLLKEYQEYLKEMKNYLKKDKTLNKKIMIKKLKKVNNKRK